MRRLLQLTFIALLACLVLDSGSAAAQHRLGLEVITGVTRPAMESDFRPWTYGPSIGIGATYAVFPAVTNTPTMDVGIRAVYHHLKVSGDAFCCFLLPAIPANFWTTGDPLQTLELSGQFELMLGGRAARVSPVLSFGGGISWIRRGEVFLHYDGEGGRWDGRAIESRDSRHTFIAPGVGASGEVFGRRVTAEARATIGGDRRFLLIPLNLRVRL